jgi:hypothetical protein
MVGSTDPVFPGDGPFGGITPGGADGRDWLLNHPTNLLLSPTATSWWSRGTTTSC